MTFEFGDVEPEDAWEPGDTVAEQVDNLVRRAELLDRVVIIPRGDIHETLDAIVDLVVLARRRGLNDRELVRADQIDDDVVFVRARL